MAHEEEHPTSEHCREEILGQHAGAAPVGVGCREDLASQLLQDRICESGRSAGVCGVFSHAAKAFSGYDSMSVRFCHSCTAKTQIALHVI